MLALTARISSAVVGLTESSLVPAENRVTLASNLCQLLGMLAAKRPDCIQCTMLVGVVEATANAAAQALVSGRNHMDAVLSMHAFVFQT